MGDDREDVPSLLSGEAMDVSRYPGPVRVHLSGSMAMSRNHGDGVPGFKWVEG